MIKNQKHNKIVHASVVLSSRIRTWTYPLKNVFNWCAIRPFHFTERQHLPAKKQKIFNVNSYQTPSKIIIIKKKKKIYVMICIDVHNSLHPFHF